MDLIEGHSGVYDVLVDDRVVYSFAGCGTHLPDPSEIISLLRVN